MKPIRVVATAVSTAALLAACSSHSDLGLTPTGPTVATGASSVASPPSQQVEEAQPLRRGFLEIGTYQTEVFRPAFTIHIPVSSQWGTFGETGRRVLIGGPGGFFGVLALTGSPTEGDLEGAVTQAGARPRPVSDGFIAGLQADQVNVTAGARRFTITFAGQHLRFFPHEHATLWLLKVATSPVLVVLGANPSPSSPFREQALAALRSVRFQSGA